MEKTTKKAKKTTKLKPIAGGKKPKVTHTLATWIDLRSVLMQLENHPNAKPSVKLAYALGRNLDSIDAIAKPYFKALEKDEEYQAFRKELQEQNINSDADPRINDLKEKYKKSTDQQQELVNTEHELNLYACQMTDFKDPKTDEIAIPFGMKIMRLLGNAVIENAQ